MPTPSPSQLIGAAALDVLVAELVQNDHFLRERRADAERKQDLAEATIAELRDKLAHAELALCAARPLPPAGRQPGSRRPPRRPRGRSLAAELMSELTGGRLANQLVHLALARPTSEMRGGGRRLRNSAAATAGLRIWGVPPPRAHPLPCPRARSARTGYRPLALPRP